MKKVAKHIIVKILNWQVKRLLARNNVKLVGVGGSIGKTSTKQAIATVLSSKYRVRWQKGNYNDPVTVPLIFFGAHNPKILTSLFSWLRILISNEVQIRNNYPYEIVVLELGTDGKGQISSFGKYLTLDIGVLTAISQEHMEYFEDLEAVAKEEGAIADFSTTLIYNKDLVGKFAPKQAVSYGMKNADYLLKDVVRQDTKISFEISNKKRKVVSSQYGGISEMGLYSVAAAALVGDLLGLTKSELETGIRKIEPFAGRMRLLNGIKGSVIIDDSYNASPVAVKAALDVLYGMKNPQKIALLGSMNEMGSYSQSAHQEVAKYCDPAKLDILITLGVDANKYLAPVAKERGCKVMTTRSPYQAGELIRELVDHEAAILVKGSQNGVFAEEAIKSLLEDMSDTKKLVRQDEYWIQIKQEQFKVL